MFTEVYVKYNTAITLVDRMRLKLKPSYTHIKLDVDLTGQNQDMPKIKSERAKIKAQ